MVKYFVCFLLLLFFCNQTTAPIATKQPQKDTTEVVQEDPGFVVSVGISVIANKNPKYCEHEFSCHVKFTTTDGFRSETKKEKEDRSLSQLDRSSVMVSSSGSASVSAKATFYGIQCYDGVGLINVTPRDANYWTKEAASIRVVIDCDLEEVRFELRD